MTLADNPCGDELSTPPGAQTRGDLSGLSARPTYFDVDLRDTPALTQIVATRSPEAVIHFAGYKAIGESVANPLRYADNNVASTTWPLHHLDRRRVFARRSGDVAMSYASPKRAGVERVRCTQRVVHDSCPDAWRWQSLDPIGFAPLPAPAPPLISVGS